jgi:hypothetical protein
VQDVVFQGVNSIPFLHALHDCRSADKLLWPHPSATTIIPHEGAKTSFELKKTWAYIVKFVGSARKPYFVHQIVLEDSRARHSEAATEAERASYFGGVLDVALEGGLQQARVSGSLLEQI